MANEIILQVGVKVLLKNPAGKFLLVRRNPKKYPEVGPKWDIVGGRIQPGLPLIENLKREVLEEVKLKLKKQPQLVAAQDILRIPSMHIVRLTFKGEIEGNPQLNSEHTEFNWFSFSELKALKADELDSFFKELLDKGLLP
jgi:ADP-ribose pyrophosphatase YjhB (NUDIX family)